MDLEDNHQLKYTRIGNAFNCQVEALINNVGGNLGTYLDRVFR